MELRIAEPLSVRSAHSGTPSRRTRSATDSRRFPADTTSTGHPSTALMSRSMRARVSRLEGGDLERSQVDTLRRYVEAVGGTLHVEVEYAGKRSELA